MAYLSVNRIHNSSLGQRLAEFRDAAMKNYANWRIYRNTLRELNALSSREMADLGINPSMVRRIALEAAYGNRV